MMMVGAAVVVPENAAANDGDVQPPMTLHRGNDSEPSTLDPNKSSTVTESVIINDLFMGLMTVDAAGELIPGATQRWERSEDGLRYVFHIRDDLYWSDGEPVTADDFVYSFRRLLDPMTASYYATILYILENGEAVNTGKAHPETIGARAVGPRELELRLHTPVPYLLELLGHASTYPVPAHVVERHGKDWSRPGNMVSNGAYKLVVWSPQNYVHAVRNPYFHDNDNVAIDEVFYYPTEDAATAFKQYRAGDFDIATSYPIRQHDWLIATMPDEVRVHPWLGTYYYAFNTSRTPMDDVRVRRALSMTIPREAITDQLLRYGAKPAYAIVPPGTENYHELHGMDTDASFRALGMDERIDKARRLLAEAGYGEGNPLEVTISYNTLADHKKIALVVAHGWRQIGVTTRLFNTEARVHFNNMRIADFEIARAGWIADYSDAENFLFLMQTETGPLNYGQFRHPEFDHLMREAARTLDLTERARLMAEAERIAMAEQPVAPIYYYVSRALVAPWVSGYVDNVRNIHLARYMRVTGPRQR